jgi:hypothetical protein
MRGMIIQTMMIINRMFVLIARAQVKIASCFHALAQDLSHLWHCRYGNLSHKGLRTLLSHVTRPASVGDFSFV